MDRRLSGRGVVWPLSLLLLVGCLVVPASAQEVETNAEASTLASLSVALWPEYDRPEMLVIYWGEFAADVPLPVAVEWRIPAASGGPSALAANDPDRGLLNLEYASRREGDWLILSFELATRGFQLEYYAPLSAAEGKKSYTFSYPGDYAVAEFSLSVQQPRTARQLVLDPPASTASEGLDDLTHHEVQALAVSQGESKSWTVRYVKTDDLLSASSQVTAQVEQAAPPASSPDGDNSTVWIFLIAFVALVAVGTGAFWLGRRSSGPSTSDGREAEPAFCHACGARLPRDARFCPKCSTPVRNR